MTISLFYRLSTNKRNQKVSEVCVPSDRHTVLIFRYDALRDLRVSVNNSDGYSRVNSIVWAGESRVLSNKAVPVSFLQRFRQDCAAKRCIGGRWESTEPNDWIPSIEYHSPKDHWLLYTDLKNLSFYGDALVIVTGRTVRAGVRELLVNILFLVCHPSFFPSLVLIHRCLLEHSLHVQIYIVHCASGAVAGLCVDVGRGFNGTWRHRLGTAEIIVNLKEK